MDQSWKNWTWNRMKTRLFELNFPKKKSTRRRQELPLQKDGCLRRKNLTKGQYQQMTKAREMGLFPWHDSVCVFNYSGCFGRCLFHSITGIHSRLEAANSSPSTSEIKGNSRISQKRRLSFCKLLSWLACSRLLSRSALSDLISFQFIQSIELDRGKEVDFPYLS